MQVAPNAPHNRALRKRLEAERRRLAKAAPDGSAAPEWGPSPDLDHGSLKPKTSGVQRGGQGNAGPRSSVRVRSP